MYAVEFSHRPGRDLINMAKHRTDERTARLYASAPSMPIIEDATRSAYRMLVGMVDCVFADVAQPDQARIVALNSQYFLKAGGGFVVSIKASCIDSTGYAGSGVCGGSRKITKGPVQAQGAADARAVRARPRGRRGPVPAAQVGSSWARSLHPMIVRSTGSWRARGGPSSESRPSGRQSAGPARGKRGRAPEGAGEGDCRNGP